MRTFPKFALLCTAILCSLLCGCKKEADDTKKNPDPDPAALTFTIEISGLTRTSADVFITPSDLHAKYLYFIIDKAQYDALGTDAALLEKSQAELARRAAASDKTLAQLAYEIRRIGAFARPETFSGLEADTAYYIYAYGIDDAATPTSAITKQQFRTEAVQMTDCTFTYTATPTRTSVAVNVIPSDKQQWYYYQLLTAEQFDSYGGTLQKAARTVVKQQIDAWLALGATSVKAAVESLALQGDHSYTFTGLSSDTPYYLFVCGINDDGDICTAVDGEMITTEKFAMSDNDLSVNVFDTTWDSTTVLISTTNDDPYLFVVKPLAELSGKDDDAAIIAAVVADMGDYVGKYTKHGDQTITFDKTLMPDTDYVALAFGYDGGATTPLARVDFTTEKATTDGSTTFSVAFTTSGYTIKPADASVLYIQGAIREEDYKRYDNDPSRLKNEHIKALIDLFVPDIYTAEEYLAGEGHRGNYVESDGLLSGNYFVYAICIAADCSLVGEPFVSEMHTF